MGAYVKKVVVSSDFFPSPAPRRGAAKIFQLMGFMRQKNRPVDFIA